MARIVYATGSKKCGDWYEGYGAASANRSSELKRRGRMVQRVGFVDPVLELATMAGISPAAAERILRESEPQQ